MNKVFLLLSTVLLSLSALAMGQVKAGLSTVSSGVSYEKRMLKNRITRLSDQVY